MIRWTSDREWTCFSASLVEMVLSLVEGLSVVFCVLRTMWENFGSAAHQGKAWSGDNLHPDNFGERMYTITYFSEGLLPYILRPSTLA